MSDMGKIKKPKPQTFESAAAELGEARPLEDVLRQLVKPETKKENGDPEKEPPFSTKP